MKRINGLAGHAPLDRFHSDFREFHVMIRMFHRSALCTVAAGALALAGCNKQDSIEAKDESAESVAAKIAKSNLMPKAGRWESTLSIENMEFPDMPPETQELMREHMKTSRTSFTCLTPEEAAKPDAEFFQQDSGCTYDNFSMAGGKIAADMTCNHDGGVQQINLSGTYGEESYTMNVSSTGKVGNGMPMSMAMSLASRRVGECDGTEED